MIQSDLTLRGVFVRAGICALAVTGSLEARADTIAVTLAGSHVEGIVSGGVTVRKADLRAGTSHGEVLVTERSTTIRSADGRNLESYFVRNGTTPDWDVDWGPNWRPGPGPAADFFLFEVGGNDTVRVCPRFLDGTFGAMTIVDGWSPTGVSVAGGPNQNQAVHGLGFRIEDLKDAAGAPLSATSRIRGVRIESASIDGASFLLRDPGAGSGADGNGEHFFHPTELHTASPLELTFLGPWASETDLTPNPFLDFRLAVTFRGPGGRVLTVPGFFDADGRRGDAGNHWKVRFLPPAAGTWTAVANMRRGQNVALDLDLNSGQPVASIHGRTIHFEVGPVRGDARGFYRVGTLRDVGEFHRRFDHGGYYLKAGTNGPENFLALRAIDDTTKSGGVGNLHSFGPHRADWRPGDPVLAPGDVTDDGKGVIGALNYLEEVGVNSLFLMVMNLGGDGYDVYPFVGPRKRGFEKRHYDTSRLRQWNTIFEHAQRCGISLSLVMNETELPNERWLDEGQLGIERKLFYRELIARFGHHPAIRWNLSEENDFTVQRLGQFAAYISALDAQDHAISVHNHPNDLSLFQALASNPDIDAASLQHDEHVAETHIEAVRGFALQAGRKWQVDADELGPWQIGLTDTNANDVRRKVLYDALLSGGGVEFYFGWHDLPLGGDLTLEDFRTRSEMWSYVEHARAFVEGNLPFWDMAPDDALVRNASGLFGGAEAFALPGEVYAVYYPTAASTGQLSLVGQTGAFERLWFDPRSGRFEGDVGTLTGGQWRDVGAPPSSPAEDWVLLVRRRAPLVADVPAASVSQAAIQTLSFRAGPSYAGRLYLLATSLSGTTSPFPLGGITVPITFDRWTRYALSDVQENVFENRLGQLDANGAATLRVRLDPAFVGGLVGATMTHCVVLSEPYDYASNVVTLLVQP